MTNRNESINLYRASMAAGEKVQRNEAKLAWMGMQSNAVDFHHFNMSGQMEGYRAEAAETAKAFGTACIGMTTEEVVSIITEATGE